MYLVKTLLTTPLRVVVGEESPYGHFFGGPAIHEGARFDGAEIPLHLLHCLNLNDPLLGIDAHPDYTWLPLYYGVPFDGCEFNYRVVSNDRIEILEEGAGNALTGDMPDYPLTYPKVPFRLEPLTYEEERALIYESIWDWQSRKRLSSADHQLLESLHPFTQIGGVMAFAQCAPYKTCANTDCTYWAGAAMEPLAVVPSEPIPGLSMWGEDDADWSQFVYLRCEHCGTIHTYCDCT